MSRPLPVLLITLFLLLLSSPLPAQTKEAGRIADAQPYLETVENLKDKSIEEQITGWRGFLDEHPDTTFRGEIERNLRSLEELLDETDPRRKAEKQDTERYLRAVDFAKSLSDTDKLALWEQFLSENPGSIYRSEVETRIRELRALADRKPVHPPIRRKVEPTQRQIPVVEPLPPKDKQKAFLLAASAGLVVPGMGHWYTEDYVTASLLTGVRVGAIAIGVPGIAQSNNTLIIVGAAIYAFGYFLDVVDAPYSADRYNDKAAPAAKTGWLRDDRNADLLISFQF